MGRVGTWHSVSAAALISAASSTTEALTILPSFAFRPNIMIDLKSIFLSCWSRVSRSVALTARVALNGAPGSFLDEGFPLIASVARIAGGRERLRFPRWGYATVEWGSVEAVGRVCIILQCVRKAWEPTWFSLQKPSFSGLAAAPRWAERDARPKDIREV